MRRVGFRSRRIEGGGINTITEHEALALLATAFKEPLANLTPDLDRDAIPGWDSWGAVMLIMEIGDRFAIELDAEASRKMRRVSDVLTYLRGHGVLRDESRS